MACYSVPTGTRFIFEAGQFKHLFAATFTKESRIHFMYFYYQGVKLSFCGESIATACVYYHKFYQVMNKQDYNEHVSLNNTLYIIT